MSAGGRGPYTDSTIRSGGTISPRARSRKARTARCRGPPRSRGSPAEVAASSPRRLTRSRDLSTQPLLVRRKVDEIGRGGQGSAEPLVDEVGDPLALDDPGVVEEHGLGQSTRA